MAEKDQTIEVRVPDIGDFDSVDVVEVLVSPGDAVAAEESLITLESDKASMDVPSTHAGTIESVAVKAGDQVAQGDAIVTLTVEAGAETSEASETLEKPQSAKASASQAEEPVTDSIPEDADHRAALVVIGSGPGGYTAAFRAADLGLDVLLIERYPILGGVCLNVGCIPSKALLHAAKVIEEAEAFADHGIRFGEPEIDLSKLAAWKGSVVERLTGGLASMAKGRKVRRLQGTAKFAGSHRLVVETPDDGEQTVAFEQAIVAVGSRVAKIPGIPWDDPRVMDSTGALDLDRQNEVPQRLLVVGGGIIGLEMACVYDALGSEVTVVELMDRLIPGADKDIVRPLAKRIESRYAAIHLGTKVEEIRPEEGGLRAVFASGSAKKEAPESQIFDRVLVAVGRRPNGDLIDAEAAGLVVDERGFLPVDRRQRTNVSHIFAIGDVVGQPMLAHKATHEAKVAAEVAAGEPSAFDARVIPSVAYTDPEVAWVGLTEEQAKADGVSYEKGIFPWSASGRALSVGRSEGKTKLLFDPETKKVMGGGIVGPSAGDLIAEVALAIEMGADAADIGLTVHPHPTLSETVALAAEAFEGTLTDLYLPRRKKS